MTRNDVTPEASYEILSRPERSRIDTRLGRDVTALKLYAENTNNEDANIKIHCRKQNTLLKRYETCPFVCVL